MPRHWLGRVLAAVVVMLGAGTARLWAGPPFQLDDPDVIPYHDFEFYVWGGADSVPGAVTTAGPAIEFNYSAIHNVMLHFLLPAGANIPSGGPSAFGLEDGEFGVQYRFVQESRNRPMIGTFTMLELPTGNAQRGLGAGGVIWKIPLYAQQSFGAWTVDGGGGEALNIDVPGGRSYAFGGTLVTRNVSKRLRLGAEWFAHGKEEADAASRGAVMIDFGGYYTPTADPNFQILFAYGHSVAGQPETYSYVSLYWTGNLRRRLAALSRKAPF